MANSDNLYLQTINEYIAMAAVTCTFLEATATLPDEVALVWPTNWSSMKFLFLANKYMALGDALFEVIGYSRMMHVSDSEDRPDIRIDDDIVILLTRTLALWGFHKYLTIFVLLAAVQVIPEAYYAVYYWVSFLGFTPRPLARSCFTGVYSQDAWPPFLLFVGVETFIIGLTLIKRFHSRNFSSSRDSRTLHTLYRDGTAFWFIVLAFSVANFVVMFIAPVELSNCMHPALCTRVFLNLRKAAAKECPTNPEFTMLTTLAFEHPAEPDAPSLHELEDIGVVADDDEEVVGDEELPGVMAFVHP
ncbi:hypothetical protein GSI_10981 [Ganoderma sinense ZZ0214-1]|uniref:DUF6533 domain-containing protein n=1 Tax=Ganoderma sinense ZZ0214-1 TaxID=1077348 RepID=A0A2G8S266_9APHY|nr:hypothetical protein GSI_10981 [Ganoderma sinense ZZ0214-1]